MRSIYLLIVFNVINIASTLAIPTTISGIFLYQREVEYSVEFYTNTLVEEKPQVFGASKCMPDGKFEFQFDLPSPGIIILSSIHDNFRIYCHPGDSIYIQIVNRQNVKFSGSHTNENNLLFNEGLTSDIFRITSYPEKSLEESIDDILNQYVRRSSAINSSKEDYDRDFLQFYVAEILGRKYTGIFTLIANDPSHSYDSLLVQFGNEPLINEARSRSYNNCFALLSKYISLSPGVNSNQKVRYRNSWYTQLPNPEKIQLLDAVITLPELYRLLSYSSFNNTIYKLKDTLQLDKLYPLLDELSRELPNPYLIEILRSTLNEKIKQLKLVIPYNFKAYTTDSILTQLDYYTTSPYILIDFWATWCKPCIQNLPKLNAFASENRDSIIVLAVNIQDTRSNWLEWINENNLDNITHLKLDSKESKEVYANYYFNTVPNYILIDQSGEFIVKGSPNFDPEFFLFQLQGYLYSKRL